MGEWATLSVGVGGSIPLQYFVPFVKQGWSHGSELFLMLPFC